MARPLYGAWPYVRFLVSGCGLACQQEISLVLAKTLPIQAVMDSAFKNNTRLASKSVYMYM